MAINLNKEYKLSKRANVLGIILFIIFIYFAFTVFNSNKNTSSVVRPPQDEYPSFSEETMDRDCILSCDGPESVILWNKPTYPASGAGIHDRVPCGTYCWAFNKYYNAKYGTTFYSINTNDKRVENAWGWLEEEWIIWRE